MKPITAIVTAIALSVSCQKFTYDCDLHINSRIEPSSGAQSERLDHVVAFAYYGDTLDYRLTGYRQAAEGRVTTSKEDQTRPADIRGEYSSQEGRMVFRNLSQPVIFVVMCDTVNHIYGYYQQNIDKGINDVFVTFTSAPWRFDTDPQATVRIGKWYYSK